jgi:hypothetical protein
LGRVTEPRDEDLATTADGDEEVVDAVPVPDGLPASEVAHEPSSRMALVQASPVAVQAAAVAVTGFATGMATVAAVRHHRSRKAARASRKARKALGNVVATRSFLVDIHLLDRS